SDPEIRGFVAEFIRTHPDASAFELEAAWRAQRGGDIPPEEAARVLHFYHEVEPSLVPRTETWVKLIWMIPAVLALGIYMVLWVFDHQFVIPLPFAVAF